MPDGLAPLAATARIVVAADAPGTTPRERLAHDAIHSAVLLTAREMAQWRRAGDMLEQAMTPDTLERMAVALRDFTNLEAEGHGRRKHHDTRRFAEVLRNAAVGVDQAVAERAIERSTAVVAAMEAIAKQLAADPGPMGVGFRAGHELATQPGFIRDIAGRLGSDVEPQGILHTLALLPLQLSAVAAAHGVVKMSASARSELFRAIGRAALVSARWLGVVVGYEGLAFVPRRQRVTSAEATHAGRLTERAAPRSMPGDPLDRAFGMWKGTGRDEWAERIRDDWK